MKEKRYFYITPKDYETAEKNGIPKRLLENRVRKSGWDVDRAITQPYNDKIKHTGNWTKWKGKAVVGYSTYASRLRMGWTPEKAAMTPRIAQKDRIRVKSVITEEQFAIAEQNGIKRSAVMQRYHKSKWPIERAITQPVMTKQEIAQIAVARRMEKRRNGRLEHA